MIRTLGVVVKQPSLKLAPLSRPPRHGVYLWWPEKGLGWIHPEDIDRAEVLIPSSRVFCRRDIDTTYSMLSYGDTSIRVKPTMWYEVESDGYELGDPIEVKSRMGKLKPFVATIVDILWNRQDRKIDYYLLTAGRRIKKAYRCDEFQPAMKLSQPMTVRQMDLVAKSRIR